MVDYAGCIHFHSSFSYDARTPLEEILRAGLGAGLDFAVLTDHFQMEARTQGFERYHEKGGRKLLLIVGEEISPRYNHYLALGLKTPVVTWKNQMQAQKIIDDVTEGGGFGFIAHPDHEGAPLLGSRAFPWIDWKVTGFAGLSIWDLLGDWSSALTSHWRMLYAAFRPMHVLRGPKAKTLARWDALSQKGRCVAIGETDNHGQFKRILGFRRHLFPFELAFRTIRTHVVLPAALTGDAAADIPVLLAAIREGRSYVSFDYWQNPAGFHFGAFDGKTRVGMGERLARSGPALIEAKIPGDGRFRLMRNGQVIFEERKRAHFERDLDLPGVYRVEVDQHAAGRWRPWIYSNPIWVA
jgi:hypothetical protein